MQVMTVRVLFAERLSQDSDESTSIERQHRKLTERLHADDRAVTLAGVAEDVSVSGEVNMPDRPALGEWLTEEGRAQWDEIWVTTQDRLSRDDMHFMAFIQSLLTWGKSLLVLDDSSLDLSTVEGRAIAHVKSIGPAKELARIKSRIQDSHSNLRLTPRWPGGLPPYGYETVEVVYEGGKVGKHLALDEYAVTVLHEIRGWILEGESLRGVAQRLNARGEPTSKNLRRQRMKKPTDESVWSIQAVKTILKSEALLGVKMYQQKPLKNRDGSWMQVADPVFTQDEWDSMQAAIAERRITKSRVNGASPLGGVVFCGVCGHPAAQEVYKPREITYRYYKCSGYKSTNRCPGVSMRAGEVEELVEQTFLEQCGQEYVMKRKFVPGEDNAQELAEVEKRIERLRQDRELGAYDDDPDYYAEKMREYTSRRKELSSTPVRESGWVSEKTNVTYQEVWDGADQAARRRLLLEAGVKFWIQGKNEWNVYIPEDIRDRMTQS